MLQQSMHPVQLQLLQQQPGTPQPLPPQTHIQIQSPPPKQPINFHQPALISPPPSSSSPTSIGGGSVSGPNLPKANNLAINGTTGEEDRKVRDKCLYLKQLLQDKKQLQSLNGFFLHADRILDEGKKS